MDEPRELRDQARCFSIKPLESLRPDPFAGEEGLQRIAELIDHVLRPLDLQLQEVSETLGADLLVERAGLDRPAKKRIPEILHTRNGSVVIGSGIHKPRAFTIDFMDSDVFGAVHPGNGLKETVHGNMAGFVIFSNSNDSVLTLLMADSGIYGNNNTPQSGALTNSVLVEGASLLMEETLPPLSDFLDRMQTRAQKIQKKSGSVESKIATLAAQLIRIGRRYELTVSGIGNQHIVIFDPDTAYLEFFPFLDESGPSVPWKHPLLVNGGNIVVLASDGLMKNFGKHTFDSQHAEIKRIFTEALLDEYPTAQARREPPESSEQRLSLKRRMASAIKEIFDKGGNPGHDCALIAFKVPGTSKGNV